MKSRVFIVILLSLLLGACASTPSWQDRQEVHIVRKGETLFSIAARYDRQPAELARWNQLGDGSLIYPGQVLRISGPGGRSAGSAGNSPPTSKPASRPLPSIPAQPSPNWAWPTNGQISVEFGAKPGPGTGVLINGKIGQPILAAASGRVVYAGSGLIGYGQLIILKHNDTYLSTYGYTASLLVKEGELVKKGQRIATMGEGPERKPRLHFEIRRNGEPVNPRRHLPAR